MGFNMKILNKKENQITFLAQIEESLANAVRRYFLHVPILAIDEIEISKNDSPLYDEAVAHRTGLVPLKMDKDFKEDAEIELKLSANKQGYVYSNQLAGPVKVVFPGIPLTYLDKDQELEFTAFARIGKGINHIKFSPGFMFYRNVFDIKMEKDCPSEIAEVCPQNVFSSEGGKISIKNPSECDMCEACVDICRKNKKQELLKITPNGELVITVESFGQMDPKEIFKEAINQLKKDLKEVARKVEK